MNNKRFITLAVVGAGVWGNNLLRNFFELDRVYLKTVCDTSPEVLQRVQQQYPLLRRVSSYEEVLADRAIEAVVLSTPAAQHFSMASQALERGKHVFVEKPMCLREDEALQLAELSRKAQRQLMVGHLLLYHPAITQLQQWIREGELGKLLYFSSRRLNLGCIQKEESALWSLAPHDLALLLFLFDEFPLSLSAYGGAFLQKGIEDLVTLNLRFPQGQLAHIQVSWLAPRKERELLVVGDRKMALFDDTHPTEKLHLYDRGASPAMAWKDGVFFHLRHGPTLVPSLPTVEPLRLECLRFVEAIRSGHPPLSDGWHGLQIVRLLAAAEQSLQAQGAPVPLPSLEKKGQ